MAGKGSHDGITNAIRTYLQLEGAGWGWSEGSVVGGGQGARGLLADGQGVGVGDDHQFIGLAQPVAAVFGGEFGEFEAGFGHLASFGQGERKIAGGAVGEFGGESGHGDLDRVCSCFVLACVGVWSREGW